MYTPMENPQGVTYIWSNLGGLQAETTSYITIKTMIQIPLAKPNISKITQITGKSNILGNINYRWLTGNLFVELKYQGNKNRIVEKLNFIIPFQGPVPFKVQGFSRSDVKFINASLIGSRNILIEAVVAITPSQLWGVRGGREVFGEFSRQDLIYLEKDFPKAEEILGVSIKFNTLEHLVRGQRLKVYGLREIAVLYVGEQFSGDKISSLKKIEPFVEVIQLKKEVPNLGTFTIVTQELNTRLVNPRELILEGKFSVETFLPTSQSNLWGEMVGTVKSLQEIVKAKKEKDLKLKETENIAETKEIQDLKETEKTKEIIEPKEINETKETENIKEAKGLNDINQISEEELEKIELEGNSPMAEDPVIESRPEVENRLEESRQSEKPVPGFSEGAAVEEIPAVTVVEEDNKKEEKEQPVNQEEQKIPRLSRRERMSKHMRKLKGGINDKSEIKSITPSK